MVGGGNIHRRVGGGVDDAPTGISSNNVFSALGSLRRKKNKEQGSKKGSAKPKEPEPVVIYTPKPLTDQKWGDMDVDDDDDDNYYKTTAPILSSWGPSDDTQDKEEVHTLVESESEDDGLDLGDDDIDEEHEPEPDVLAQAEPVVKIPQVPLPPKEAERQLSKKELKKKELAELDAVLAELGIDKKETDGQDESHGAQEKNELNGDVDKKESAVPAGESKSARKKKKKSKEAKDQEQPVGSHTNNGPDESAAGSEQAEGDELAALDMKERLKKISSMKKKKSSKEMDSAARAAASEASARSARLAAAKKKEKNHYNQQPVR